MTLWKAAKCNIYFFLSFIFLEPSFGLLDAVLPEMYDSEGTADRDCDVMVMFSRKEG